MMAILDNRRQYGLLRENFLAVGDEWYFYGPNNCAVAGVVPDGKQHKRKPGFILMPGGLTGLMGQ